MEEYTPNSLDLEETVKKLSEQGENIAIYASAVLDSLHVDRSIIQNEGILSVNVGEGAEIMLARKFIPSKMIVTEPNSKNDVIEQDLESAIQIPTQKILEEMKNTLPQEIRNKVEIQRLNSAQALEKAKLGNERFGLITQFNMFPDSIDTVEEFVDNAFKVTASGGAVMVTILEPDELKVLKKAGINLTLRMGVGDLRVVKAEGNRVFLTDFGSYVMTFVKP